MSIKSVQGQRPIKKVLALRCNIATGQSGGLQYAHIVSGFVPTVAVVAICNCDFSVAGG